jgi:hypothetical protein
MDHLKIRGSCWGMLGSIMCSSIFETLTLPFRDEKPTFKDA